MVKSKPILILLFVFSMLGVLNAQESKVVVLNLRTGYSVKGEIVEQTDKGVKIRTSDGQIFEYTTDEIISTTNIKSSSTSKQLFSQSKKIPLSVEKGDMFLSLGIGFFGVKSGDISEKLVMPPIPVSFEYIMVDNLFEGRGALGIGGFLGYSATKWDYSYAYEKIRNSRMIIGARGYFHYAFVEKLDTYGGVLLGYKNESTNFIGNENPGYNPDYSDGTPTANVFVGCRYFFNDRIAGMAELGWGMSNLTLGVAIKL
jgi:hypothetical protein